VFKFFSNIYFKTDYAVKQYSTNSSATLHAYFVMEAAQNMY